MLESSGFNTYGEYFLLEHSLDILPTNELSGFQAAGAVQLGPEEAQNSHNLALKRLLMCVCVL